MVPWASTGTNKKINKSPDSVRTWYSCKITYLTPSLCKITYLTPSFRLCDPSLLKNNFKRTGERFHQRFKVEYRYLIEKGLTFFFLDFFFVLAGGHLGILFKGVIKGG